MVGKGSPGRDWSAMAAGRWLACAIVLGAGHAGAAPRPNIILILADDLGAREAGCYGNTFNETPHIDRLAAEGMLFTRAYSPSTVCSPTRASILTGQDPARHGITDFLEDGDDAFLDPIRVTALPKVLKAAGYRTGIIGKWHLTGDYAAGRGRPEEHGFDEVILSETGYISSGDYRYPYAHVAGAAQRIFPKEDLTDRLNLEALDFIGRNRSGPFLLYLSHYAVHRTLDAPDSAVKYFEAKRNASGDAASPARNPVLAAMLGRVDDGVGGIRARLQALGLDSNTLILFASDNGGDKGITDNGELRSHKGTVYEGGIRVPLVVRWPGMVPAGRVCGRPVGLADLFPTCLAMAGAAQPAGQPVDGIDIGPLLREIGDIAPRNLAWHFPQPTLNKHGRLSSAALLDPGGRKVIRFYDTGRLELYDLAADGSETRDLAAGNPGTARALAAALHAKVDSCLWDYSWQEDFSDRDSEGWSFYGGKWSPATGSLRSDSGEGLKAVTEDRYFTDLEYEADVTPARSGNAGLLFRAGAAGNGRFAYRGYLATLNAATGRVELVRTLDGAADLLASAAFPLRAGTAYRMRVTARGPEIKVFLGDTAVALVAARDTAFEGGLIGVRAHNGRAAFDSLSVRGLRPVEGTTRIARAPSAARAARTAWKRDGTWLFPIPSGKRDPGKARIDALGGRR